MIATKLIDWHLQHVSYKKMVLMACQTCALADQQFEVLQNECLLKPCNMDEGESPKTQKKRLHLLDCYVTLLSSVCSPS